MRTYRIEFVCRGYYRVIMVVDGSQAHAVSVSSEIAAKVIGETWTENAVK